LAVVTLPMGLTIGFLTALAMLSPRPWLRCTGFAYTTAVRGIPELLTLFVVYYGIGLLLNRINIAIDPETETFALSPFIAGAVALGLVFGAFSGEVLRGAFQSLASGQIEAATACGLTPWQVFRLVKLPQVWRFALPGLGNLWISLIKDTALVSVIALNDLMRTAFVAVGSTKKPFLFYSAVCLIYWLLSVTSEIVIAGLEQRANRGLRRA